MRFSEHFDLSGNQAQFDFVDIPLATDIRVFIDPYAITTTRTPWCIRCHGIVTDFFQNVLDALRAGDRDTAMALLCEMREDNRTRTGFSKGEPQGTGWGPEKAELLIDALMSSEAFASGLIEDIEDGALFADKVGRDTISDAMVNILHEPLAEYTREQCELYGVPMNAKEKMKSWCPGNGWVTIETELPVAHDRSILLMPRTIVRKDLSLRPDQFLTDFLNEYIDPSNMNARRALEETLQGPIPTKGKTGNIKTHKGKVRDKLKAKGTNKNVMARITRHFPEALKGFKTRARKGRPTLTPFELENLQPDRHSVDIAEVAAEMRLAAKNADDVWYSLVGVVGGLVAAFHPLLQHPQPVDGLKHGVAGAVMANTGTKGVLWQARRLGGKKQRPNVLVLTSAKPIDELLIRKIGHETLLGEADAGAAFFVGPSISKDVRASREALTKKGLFVVTMDELAEIVETDTEPDVAVDHLTSLFAG